jgi:hypothetical protein
LWLLKEHWPRIRSGDDSKCPGCSFESADDSSDEECEDCGDADSGGDFVNVAVARYSPSEHAGADCSLTTLPLSPIRRCLSSRLLNCSGTPMKALLASLSLCVCFYCEEITIQLSKTEAHFNKLIFE